MGGISVVINGVLPFTGSSLAVELLKVAAWLLVLGLLGVLVVRRRRRGGLELGEPLIDRH